MLLRMKLEAIEHARLRALAQLIADKEKGVEAFEEYMKLAFPYAEASKRAEKDAYVKQLVNEIGKGAIKVQPLTPPKMTSRVMTAKGRKSDPKTLHSISKKIGTAF